MVICKSLSPRRPSHRSLLGGFDEQQTQSLQIALSGPQNDDVKHTTDPFRLKDYVEARDPFGDAVVLLENW